MAELGSTKIDFAIKFQNGIKKMLVMLLLDNHSHVCETDPWPWGGEPILRNGVLVGRVTTTSFGFTLGQVKKF
jgi:pyruvate dehydrogenase phosphatase regulatory subunit